MKALTLQPTEYTPQIILDPINYRFVFTGESYPENTFEFYEPILEWFRDFLSQKKDMILEMELTYLNSSSLKSFYDIFEFLNAHAKEFNSRIIIQWIYDEENDIALETGQNMDEDFEHLTFEYLQKE
ncbi:MAG: DUF1987 domain-containing protein [Thiovulaceae bacterium]|nr:DUF1987 domain-containing protein [Sulfurimonadaceae bacterium]MDD3816943.1 DUF1987 domain-containing protein [Sulfurimonadaceae bacterium]